MERFVLELVASYLRKRTIANGKLSTDLVSVIPYYLRNSRNDDWDICERINDDNWTYFALVMALEGSSGTVTFVGVNTGIAYVLHETWNDEPFDMMETAKMSGAIEFIPRFIRMYFRITNGIVEVERCSFRLGQVYEIYGGDDDISIWSIPLILGFGYEIDLTMDDMVDENVFSKLITLVNANKKRIITEGRNIFKYLSFPGIGKRSMCGVEFQ
uniref:Uncharacterized protein n=1 Tax=viral metagenome TaxID=1070528 RepID=A0A2V0RME8_9ZZZZ